MGRRGKGTKHERRETEILGADDQRNFEQTQDRRDAASRETCISSCQLDEEGERPDPKLGLASFNLMQAREAPFMPTGVRLQ